MRPITLFTIFLVIGICEGSPRVILTRYQDLMHWTCFSSSTSAGCCKDIDVAALELGISNPSNCERLVAEVPNVPMLQDHDMAKYSLILQSSDSGITSESVLQYRWEGRIWKNQSSPSSPYFWSDIRKTDKSVKLQAVLSQDGGMHRQMISTLKSIQGFESYFLVMTVPESMFVDLDDFFADSKSTPYAAKVCDIEKPAFVSGQHVIVVEVHSDSSSIQRTKWHIRYPHPKPGGAEVIQNLAEPHGLFMNDGFLYFYPHFAKLPDVPVSTGYLQDWDLVLWGTMISCWFGVWKMIRDISSVSYWDP